ncbi:hypothetical protein [Dechloromonas denitrificans]|uniref:hypothetical protein n=1 Tax=Dechloromonas denitrificans TaxID=281362 RepID=UPI001CF82539|nr:hypothetical protein [Dechloromonas denitrificans]UCV04947.1 hypothetical protein KI611_06725 [Dechloromonas denitrificans]
MDWNEHFAAWLQVVNNPGPEEHLQMQAARKRVKNNSPSDWSWLAEGVGEPNKKLFVAQVFQRQPLPKRLFKPFLLAGVLEKNPSANRYFIEPCVRSFGTQAVNEVLLQYLKEGTNEEKAGAASAMYWVRGEQSDEVRAQIREVFLQEFVANKDIEVRRRIVPALQLNPALYNEEIQPLITKAISIARTHSDEYIRHRIEIQLGSDGPFKGIPTNHGT